MTAVPRLPFVPFDLEEWQSRWETTVELNLADSGCHPVRLDELLGGQARIDDMLAVELHYPPVAGTDRLRALIADWHGARAENVLVTVGASEANAIAVATLVGPGDEVVVMEPGYRQVRGLAENLGASVAGFPLDATRSWRPDLDALSRAVSPRTRLISITNPDNPVGTILTGDEAAAVLAVAERVGAWLLVDEVYRGTERLTDEVTPTLWGRYDRVVCVGSLSKAFGLPGLRIGWLVAPVEAVEAMWRRHEYATIATGTLSMHLAEIALEPATRSRLLARNRALIRHGWERLAAWVAGNDDLLSVVPPAATALGFVHYALDRPSVEVARALRERASVLVAPGSAFGVEHHLRITHGVRPDLLEEALSRATLVIWDLA